MPKPVSERRGIEGLSRPPPAGVPPGCLGRLRARGDWGVRRAPHVQSSSPPPASVVPRGAPGCLGRLRARGDWGVVEPPMFSRRAPPSERGPEGRPRYPGAAPSAGGIGGSSSAPPCSVVEPHPQRAWSRGAPQVPWGGSERGGIGGSSSAPPMFSRRAPPPASVVPRGAPGTLGRLRARGDWGVVEPPHVQSSSRPSERGPEGRPRYPGAAPSAGGLGGRRAPPCSSVTLGSPLEASRNPVGLPDFKSGVRL